MFRGVCVLLMVLSFFGCEMTKQQRSDWNLGASHTAQQNLANGLPDAEVWCMEPADRNPNTTNLTVVPYVVPSRVMQAANFDCELATLYNTDGYACDATFCYIYGYQPSQTISPNQVPILQA